MKYSIATILFLFVLLNIRAQQKTSVNYKYKFVVAKDGTGDYQFIQDAIDAMRVFATEPIVVYIKNGIYNEKIELPATKTGVSFIGESVEKTIITYNDYSGRGKTNTFTSFTAKICGNRFVAENISFVNTAGPVGQAVALHVESDQATFRNCRFLGYQDTIFASGESSRQLFMNCFIEGTTDFIFGPATAVFLDCIINSKANSFITAANTPRDQTYGFVFIRCKLQADSGITNVFLGRPWRAYAKTVFLDCTMDAHINAAGWNNWNDSANEASVFYAEFQSKGSGAKPNQRVKWCRQLNLKEAADYTMEKIFAVSSTRSRSTSDWFKQFINGK